MKDLISVIIPVYKVEQYLASCMETVLHQSYENLEIILVDDGSPDSCGKMCDEYAAADSRVVVIHKSNGGLSDARNAGLDIAKGKYIVFIDSDDSVSKDYVEYMYQMLVHHPEASISICGVQRIQQGESILPSTESGQAVLTPERAFENLLYDGGIDVCSYAKMYTKELFDDIRFPVGKVYEDSATTYKLFEKCEFLVFGDKKCYYYFTRPGSISKQGQFNPREYDYIEHTAQMLAHIQEHYPDIQGALDRYYVYSRFRILRMLVYTLPRDREFEKKLLQEIRVKRKRVFWDTNVPKRDKIAILTSLFGVGVYKVAWYLYSKLTGRIL